MCNSDLVYNPGISISLRCKNYFQVLCMLHGTFVPVPGNLTLPIHTRLLLKVFRDIQFIVERHIIYTYKSSNYNTCSMNVICCIIDRLFPFSKNSFCISYGIIALICLGVCAFFSAEQWILVVVIPQKSIVYLSCLWSLWIQFLCDCEKYNISIIILLMGLNVKYICSQIYSL